ncbi:YigZ family protein [Agathobacter rectalis]|uniref:YigZ family protein n=2 Tax=Agathobacter rectalis TaxID=39491 RepID=UPI0027D34F78|nr:YigZ family protein [Agathobacter rectalis]
MERISMSENTISLYVYKGGQGEITEKKSRFIATVRPVESEDEAVSFINETKKKYWDARHNCSAFVIGKRQELTRCSDDGEPAGTAGRPMLDVLLKENIHNAAVVVTRYFGGVLLGTGGLVRAYQQATKAGLSASEIIEKKDGAVLFIRTDYTGIGRLQYLFAQEKITVMDTAYEADVLVKAVIPENDKKRIEKTIIEQTNGMAKLEWGDEVTFAEYDGEVLLFKN